MKVLLVEPPKITWELMGGNCVSPPLGLAQLAAVLAEANTEVNIIDCNAAGINWSGLEKNIEASQPDIVGVTAITPFFHQALRTAKVAKKVKPKIITTGERGSEVLDSSYSFCSMFLAVVCLLVSLHKPR